MRGVREEVESLDGVDMVFLEENLDIAGLGGGVAGKVNNFRWMNF